MYLKYKTDYEYQNRRFCTNPSQLVKLIEVDKNPIENITTWEIASELKHIQIEHFYWEAKYNQ